MVVIIQFMSVYEIFIQSPFLTLPLLLISLDGKNIHLKTVISGIRVAKTS